MVNDKTGTILDPEDVQPMLLQPMAAKPMAATPKFRTKHTPTIGVDREKCFERNNQKSHTMLMEKLVQTRNLQVMSDAKPSDVPKLTSFRIEFRTKTEDKRFISTVIESGVGIVEL